MFPFAPMSAFAQFQCPLLQFPFVIPLTARRFSLISDGVAIITKVICAVHHGSLVTDRIGIKRTRNNQELFPCPHLPRLSLLCPP